MTKQTIALFGEAERGSFNKPYICKSVDQLADLFGNPPPESYGIFMAVQALLYEYALLFFRVREEGFSLNDYYQGLHILGSQASEDVALTALAVPGVGDTGLIEASCAFCADHDSILLMSEQDFYDYVTSKPRL